MISMKIIKHKISYSTCLLWGLAAVVFLSQNSTVYAGGDDDRQLVANKLKLAEYILTKSEMIKSILVSENQQGKRLIHQASKDYTQAKSLLESDQIHQADIKLTQLLQALGSISGSNRHATSANAQAQKYKELVVTIKTLMESMQTELDQLGDGEFSTVKLENILATAETLARESRYQAANNLLSEVYYNLKLFIKQQRENKTLVYSLDFNSLEDEYKYELRRYKSFSMLMDMSLKKKDLAEKTVLRAGQHMLKASETKLEASILAKNRKFTEAIKTQEQANEHLIRALRIVGLMIP